MTLYLLGYSCAVCGPLNLIHWIASPLTLKFQPARSHGPIRFGDDEVSTNLIGPSDLAG